VDSLVETSHHKGPGYVDLAGEDSEPDVEKVSEGQYKRHEYNLHGLLLGFGVMFWFMVAGYAKDKYKMEMEKHELEKSWMRIILNPKNIQYIRRSPWAYRDDFKEWITEIRPDLLAKADPELENWYKTGDKFYFGEGVAKDATEAVNWYRKAAEKDHVRAQHALGECYYNGKGVAKDAKEAVKWYRKAAEQNHAPSQHNLGFCYEMGHGVTLYTEAVQWYRKAAEQNFAIAQNNLGLCYEMGYGVQQDFAEAYMFYKLAAKQIHEKTIRNLERLTAQMTAAEIAEGERRVIEYLSCVLIFA
jgi:hypothetical protein